MRPMSLAFTFEVALDDRKYRVTNRPGDAVRLRARFAGEGRSLDALLGEQGIASYEVLFAFAWAALRHTDGYEALTFEEFMDRCEDWAIVSDEGPPRPTVAGPSSDSSSSSPSPPTPPPATGGTNP